MTVTTLRQPGPVRVAVAEESELTAGGLSLVLQDVPDLVFVGGHEPGTSSRIVDILLHDPFGHGTPAQDRDVESWVRRAGSGRYVVFTWNPQSHLVGPVMEQGAAGCLSKWLPGDELVDGLRRIARGEVVVSHSDRDTTAGWEQAGLTPRERDVLAYIGAGFSNLEIAELTQLSINSIKSYIRSAYRKIDATSRSQAVLWAVRHGCVPISDPAA